jgi:MFS family permease
MEPESGSRSGFSLTRFGLRGSAGLVVAVSVVAILLIALPAYRWFFLISVLIGLVIAGGLTLWHKLHPIKEQDVHPKRPLGL